MTLLNRLITSETDYEVKEFLIALLKHFQDNDGVINNLIITEKDVTFNFLPIDYTETKSSFYSNVKNEKEQYAVLTRLIKIYVRKNGYESKDLLLKRFGTDSISSLHKECYINLIEAIEDDLIKK